MKRLLLTILSCFGFTLIMAQSNCAAAISVPNGFSANGVTTSGSCNSPFTNVSSCSDNNSYYEDGDVYIYSIDVQDGGELMVDLDPYNDWMAVGLFTNCTGSTLDGCLDSESNGGDTGFLSVSGVNSTGATLTFYIVVGVWGGFDPCDLDFDIEILASGGECLDPNAPADNCSNAILIDLDEPFNGSTDCSYSVDLPNSPYNSPSNWCGTIENNSWLQFIAGQTNVELQWEVFASLPCDDGVQFSVWQGSCGNLSLLNGTCLNPLDPGATGDVGETGAWNLSGLTIGQQYYIMVDGFDGDLCEYAITPIEGIVITPPNDSCLSALPIACSDTFSSNNILATDNIIPSSCNAGLPGKGLWYTLIGNGESVSLSTDLPETNFDTQINVYTAPDCSGPFTCITGDDDSGSGNTSTLTFTTVNGTTYYIYADGDGNAEGSFAITAQCQSCLASPTMQWD